MCTHKVIMENNKAEEINDEQKMESIREGKIEETTKRQKLEKYPAKTTLPRK